MACEYETVDIVEYTVAPGGSDDGVEGPQALSCVVCGDAETELVFRQEQQPVRRVAIPERSALCAPCVLLVTTGRFELAADRASDDWADFARVDLLDTLRDMKESIASRRPDRETRFPQV